MSQTIGLPLTFLARMAALLDEEFPSFLVALSQPPLSGLRVNTLKLSVDQFQALSPWELAPVPWCEAGFVLPRANTAGMHPLHDAGLYYLQEPSTMAVATLLAPQPGERVLDLCASPGGKATHIAALMQGQGVLVANEIERERAEVLARNLERWGARHAIVLNEAPERLAHRWPGAFDRVLVDAPCSGEGMFRKNELARQHWNESHVRGCALRQRAILDWAAQLVRPGGRLVYATCTFAPEENEGTIWRFLQDHRDFDLVQAPWYPGFSPGHPTWHDWPYSDLDATAFADGAGAQAPVQPADQPEHGRTIELLRRAVHLWPHKSEGEGHFIAVLQRQGNGPRQPWALVKPVRLASAGQAALDEFWTTTMSDAVPERLLTRLRGQGAAEVYAVAPETPDTDGLRAVRPGWHVGTLRSGAPRPAGGKERFLPAHALALGLARQERRDQCRLEEPLGSELVARYLHGETLDGPGPDGWVLICLAGFPLGWGKRTGGVIKNHYPKSLRWIGTFAG